MSFFLFAQIWTFTLVVKYPYWGIELEQNSSREWRIKSLNEDGNGIKLGLKVGDQVLEIDHMEPHLYHTVQDWSNVEQARHLLIQRDGQEMEATVKSRAVPLFDYIPLFEEAICLIIAGMIRFKMPRYKSTQLLMLVFLCGAFVYMSLGASVRGDYIGKALIGSLTALLPILFLHFLLVFFEEKSNIRLSKLMLKIAYPGVCAILLFQIVTMLSPQTILFYQFSKILIQLFFIIGSLCNLALLSYMYVRHGRDGSSLSTVIKFIGMSLLVSFLPIICLSFVPAMTIGYSLIDAIYTSLFMLFFPASFAYLIASDQLYDIGLVVRRFLFGCLLALVPASLFTGLYSAIFFRTVGKEEIIFVFLGSILMLSTMLYSTEYLTTRLEPVFFPRKNMLNTSLRKISKNLSTVSTMREMKDIFLADIVQTLEVQGGAIICQYPDSMEIIGAGEVNIEEMEALLEEGVLLSSPHYTCLEISRTEEATNYLVMTRKRTNVLLSREEQQWLGLITSYLEVSLENIHLIRTLTNKLQDLSSRFSDDTSAAEFQWFRKVMFELQEEERVRIASDLHDTTMQDLFFLKRRLSTLMEKYALNQEDKEHLDNMLKFVDLINAGLRQSCFELNPHLLREIGLVPTLRQYLDKEAYTAPFDIHFEPGSNTGRVEQEPLSTKRHLLRIIQELLNNARKHSHASRVSFRLGAAPREFQLIYEDDGVGMQSMGSHLPEIGGSGTGMEQMKGRVLLLRGSMELRNKPGSGIKISISIPMREVPDNGLNHQSTGR
ncbi:sensor histidine kinase [Paenibacillus sp. YN15]|uniref:sensor histidine kinase n=1 Tax=Paenibacillus sp. YN15 TaxID=1742774 RepID=UPI0015EC3859|nr:ATP-binding protein [Paenibacillus sp. YN15]